MFVFGVVSIELWHTEFPIWAFVLSLAIGELQYVIILIDYLIISAVII